MDPSAIIQLEGAFERGVSSRQESPEDRLPVRKISGINHAASEQYLTQDALERIQNVEQPGQLPKQSGPHEFYEGAEADWIQFFIHASHVTLVNRLNEFLTARKKSEALPRLYIVALAVVHMVEEYEMARMERGILQENKPNVEVELTRICAEIERAASSWVQEQGEEKARLILGRRKKLRGEFGKMGALRRIIAFQAREQLRNLENLLPPIVREQGADIVMRDDSPMVGIEFPPEADDGEHVYFDLRHEQARLKEAEREMESLQKRLQFFQTFFERLRDKTYQPFLHP